ncbi:MAG: hypothetical protein A2383_01805 [Candidatus Pacebacteria bacterium RIFOXYB1_FULL_39_46]|nr:MAG: hypothetical protein A2182_03320 [Candidatus Pacebacteria bacterium RIFOXYA1_FULL_38_18]OGJ37904.1 MAG: hypothetical protein A2383_01805 [Candidatus Pacebacteria bacterium RIFOXYB1_FULL_39_46]OGJ39503.1 MAG: hypothetical protein A2411_01960 [Candidatus Pacebacteria bacterium RIFOXYC1_FULL_39_21]OGJ40083.1 MAG: hypothetical protein A2582_03250 [Candidatus Pacebacteria bacterium RIFOXYD1_FULL_39_27]
MFTKLPQPIEPRFVIRLLVAIIVILAFLAGYYHSALGVEQEKLKQLEIQIESLQIKEIEIEEKL